MQPIQTRRGGAAIALRTSLPAPFDSPPVNSVLPVISGDAAAGETLACSTGTWIGTPPITFAYQWKADGVAIGGETSSTYDIVIGDAGKDITCTVTATNSNGSTSVDAAAVTVINYPLDVIATQPAAAYGIRKLSSAYAGSAIRVKRASDSTDLDIGFVGVGLDQTTLDAFLAGTTGIATVFYDQSGNGNHGTTSSGSEPEITPRILRGNRTVTFRGKQFTIPVAVASTRQAVTAFFANNLNTLGVDGLLELSGNFWFFQQDTQRLPGFSSSIIPHNGLAIYGFRGNATNLRISDDERTEDGAGTTATAFAGGTLGAMPAAAYTFTGDLTSTLIYTSALSDGDYSLVRSAMHQVHNISETKLTRVWAFGDSIFSSSFGAYFGSPIIEATNSLDGLRLVNISGGGRQLTACSGFYTANQAAIQAEPGVLVLGAGTNDIGLTADSVATIHTRYQNFCLGAQADGCKVVACTMLPRSDLSVGRLADLDAFNALIRANWASYADALADINAVAGDPTDMAFYPDGLHPLIGECIAQGPVIAAAIESVL